MQALTVIVVDRVLRNVGSEAIDDDVDWNTQGTIGKPLDPCNKAPSALGDYRRRVHQAITNRQLGQKPRCRFYL